MTEVCKACIARAWKTYPELERLEAGVYSWNANGTKVLKKIGFEEEGRSKAAVFKFGKRCDMLHFGLVQEGITIDDEPPETPRHGLLVKQQPWANAHNAHTNDAKSAIGACVNDMGR